MRVDQQRHRIGNADRVSDLDRAVVGEAGRDDVLGEIARGIGGRAVDLGRVLAGERAAAVRRIAAVGVDDDLAAGEAAVAVGTADDEVAGRVDEEVGRLLRHPALRQRRLDRSRDHVLDHAGVYFLPLRVSALCWVETTTLVQPTGLPFDVLHGHLALGVRLQIEQLLRTDACRPAPSGSCARRKSAPA